MFGLSQGDRAVTVRSLWGCRKTDDCSIAVRFHWYRTGSERQPCDTRASVVARTHDLRTVVFDPNDHIKLCDFCVISARPPRDAPAGICDVTYDMSTGYALKEITSQKSVCLQNHVFEDKMTKC